MRAAIGQSNYSLALTEVFRESGDIWRTPWWSDSDSGSTVPAPDVNPQSPTLEITVEYGRQGFVFVGSHGDRCTLWGSVSYFLDDHGGCCDRGIQITMV